MKNRYALIHFLATNENETEPYNGLAVIKVNTENDDNTKICNNFALIRFLEKGESIKYARVLYKDVAEEKNATNEILSEYILSTLKGGMICEPIIEQL